MKIYIIYSIRHSQYFVNKRVFVFNNDFKNILMISVGQSSIKGTHKIKGNLYTWKQKQCLYCNYIGRADHVKRHMDRLHKDENDKEERWINERCIKSKSRPLEA